MKKLLRLLIAILILPVWFVSQLTFMLGLLIVFVCCSLNETKSIYEPTKQDVIESWTSLYRWVKQ